MSLPTLDELMERSLVPGASGLFVKIMSAAQVRDGDARAVLIERIRTLWDPWACPASELPLLAWAWSVDIWDDTWPELRKRSVVSEARAYHERKTTVAGYRMALGYRDAQLVRAHTPREGFFVGAGPTPESHLRWLESLPEIRIYAATPILRPGRKGFWAGVTILRSMEKVLWDTRRAELIRDGVTTPLVISGLSRDESGRLLSEPERLLIPGPESRSLKAGGFLGRPVASGAIAGQRIVSLSRTMSDNPFLPNAAVPSLTPVDVTPRYMAETRPATGSGFFVGGMRRFVRANNAQYSFYESFRLNDGLSTGVAPTAMRNVVGRSRLRRPAFTVGLLVHAPRSVQHSFFPKGRVARAAPWKLIEELEQAIVSASAARDTPFMDINSTRPLTYADLAHLPDDATYGRVVLN